MTRLFNDQMKLLQARFNLDEPQLLQLISMGAHLKMCNLIENGDSAKALLYKKLREQAKECMTEYSKGVLMLSE